jgi:hypothetical protein
MGYAILKVQQRAMRSAQMLGADESPTEAYVGYAAGRGFVGNDADGCLSSLSLRV